MRIFFAKKNQYISEHWIKCFSPKSMYVNDSVNGAPHHDFFLEVKFLVCHAELFDGVLFYPFSSPVVDVVFPCFADEVPGGVLSQSN
jgi:hypothetical protein